MPSQHEEDALIAQFLTLLGISKGLFIEIGVNDLSAGKQIQCNTHALLERGWKGVWIDAVFKHPNISNVFVTPDNILEVFKKAGAEKNLDFFSIDIDSTDWFVMKTVLESKCDIKLICTEVNGYHEKGVDLIMPLEHERPGKSRCFGATLLAYQKLFKRHDYELVGVTSNGVNAFWVKKSDAHLFENPGDYDFHYRKTNIVNNWSKDHVSDRYTTADSQLS